MTVLVMGGNVESPRLIVIKSGQGPRSVEEVVGVARLRQLLGLSVAQDGVTSHLVVNSPGSGTEGIA